MPKTLVLILGYIKLCRRPYASLKLSGQRKSKKIRTRLTIYLFHAPSPQSRNYYVQFLLASPALHLQCQMCLVITNIYLRLVSSSSLGPASQHPWSVKPLIIPASGTTTRGVLAWEVPQYFPKFSLEMRNKMWVWPPISLPAKFGEVLHITD